MIKLISLLKEIEILPLIKPLDLINLWGKLEGHDKFILGRKYILNNNYRNDYNYDGKIRPLTNFIFKVYEKDKNFYLELQKEIQKTLRREQLQEIEIDIPVKLIVGKFYDIREYDDWEFDWEYKGMNYNHYVFTNPDLDEHGVKYIDKGSMKYLLKNRDIKYTSGQ